MKIIEDLILVFGTVENPGNSAVVVETEDFKFTAFFDHRTEAYVDSLQLGEEYKLTLPSSVIKKIDVMKKGRVFKIGLRNFKPVSTPYFMDDGEICFLKIAEVKEKKNDEPGKNIT